MPSDFCRDLVFEKIKGYVNTFTGSKKDIATLYVSPSLDILEIRNRDTEMSQAGGGGGRHSHNPKNLRMAKHLQMGHMLVPISIILPGNGWFSCKWNEIWSNLVNFG